MQTLTAAGLGRYMKKHQYSVVVSKRDENSVDKKWVSLLFYGAAQLCGNLAQCGAWMGHPLRF